MTIEAQAVDHNSPSAAEVKGRYGYARKYIEENGVGIKHFRHTVHVPDGRLVNQFGGMTVAFQQKGGFVLVATAVCSDDDNYNAKLGTALATERLANNHAIVVPLMGVSALDAVNDMFQHLYEDFSVLESFGGFGQELDDERFGPSFGHPSQLAQLAQVLSAGAEEAGAAEEPYGFFSDLPEEPGQNETQPDLSVWEEHAKVLVSSLVSKLGGTPQDILDGLKYLLEDADEQEVVTVLSGTPAESLAGSSAVLASVRKTAVQLLTAGADGQPRLTLVLRVRAPSHLTGQEQGGSPDDFNPFAALGQGLADMLSKAGSDVAGRIEGAEDRIRSLGDLKSAFKAIPASDLLAALRKTPHAAAAAAFLSKLQAPKRGDYEGDRG